MHCEGFAERLQEVLDRRDDPGTDAGLQTHARQCPLCRQRLGSWIQLESAIGPAPAAVPRRTGGRLLVAVILAMAVLGWHGLSPDPTKTAKVETRAEAAHASSHLERSLTGPTVPLELDVATRSALELSLRTKEAWGPVLEGIRPVTGSLNAAVRAFAPTSIRLSSEPADQAAYEDASRDRYA